MIGGTPARILIVDDDPALLEALPDTIRVRLLHSVVETADSAEAALTCIAATDYDVIVTDLVMPGMTGAELIPKIRDVRPSTPMILMSGNPNPLGYALRAGAYAVLQKPIDREFFIATLRRAIRYSRLSKQINGTVQHAKQHLERLAQLQRNADENGVTTRGHCVGGTLITSVSERITPRSSHQS